MCQNMTVIGTKVKTVTVVKARCHSLYIALSHFHKTARLLQVIVANSSLKLHTSIAHGWVTAQKLAVSSLNMSLSLLLHGRANRDIGNVAEVIPVPNIDVVAEYFYSFKDK